MLEDGAKVLGCGWSYPMAIRFEVLLYSCDLEKEDNSR